MPNPNAIVSTIVEIDPPADKALAEKLNISDGVNLTLENGKQARLNPEDPRSYAYLSVLNGISKHGLPAYLELDPDNQFIKVIHIPHVTRVVGIYPPQEGGLLDVELEFSHARHVLQKDHEDAPELEKLLRQAETQATPIIVTEDDAHNIIDVRLYKPSSETKEITFPKERPVKPALKELKSNKLKDGIFRIIDICIWPWLWFNCRCISQTRAVQAFNSMAATSCNPQAIAAPCIPFLYPDDGCWGRAHEMCRLMINMGLKPKKIWIRGSLRVNTVNNPDCYVRWGWHVAPTLCVRGRWFFNTETKVIDPSLFSGPVSTAEWKNIQGDPNAQLTPSAASIFYLWQNPPATDPNYAQTNNVLNTYRLQLQNRVASFGAPPYANCP